MKKIFFFLFGVLCFVVAIYAVVARMITDNIFNMGIDSLIEWSRVLANIGKYIELAFVIAIFIGGLFGILFSKMNGILKLILAVVFIAAMLYGFHLFDELMGIIRK